MLNFNEVWEKIYNNYVEDYGNISYYIAKKGSFGSNSPKTLYIEISKEYYYEDTFWNIVIWLGENAKSYKILGDGEEYHFDDFDVIIKEIS